MRWISLMTFATSLLFGGLVRAEVAVDKPAPLFSLKTQSGEAFNLADRKDKGWTVIYFYPKADSPGCTEQACAFRDTIKKIQAKNAMLIGISADDVSKQKEFHDKHKLTFDLLADPDLKVIEQYGIKVPVVGIAKRWTFIVDPSLTVRSVEKDVDPAFDAEWTATVLDELQNPPKTEADDDDPDGDDAEKVEKVDNVETVEKAEKVEKSEKPDKTDKVEPTEKSAAPATK